MSGKRRAAEHTKDPSARAPVLAAAFPLEGRRSRGGAERHLPRSHFPSVAVTEHTRRPPVLPVLRAPPPAPSLLDSLVLKIKRRPRCQLTPRTRRAPRRHTPSRAARGRAAPGPSARTRAASERRPGAPHLSGPFPPLTAAVELLAAVAPRSGVLVHRCASAERPLCARPARGEGARVAMAAAAPRIRPRRPITAGPLRRTKPGEGARRWGQGDADRGGRPPVHTPSTLARAPPARSPALRPPGTSTRTDTTSRCGNQRPPRCASDPRSL